MDDADLVEALDAAENIISSAGQLPQITISAKSNDNISKLVRSADSLVRFKYPYLMNQEG